MEDLNNFLDLPSPTNSLHYGYTEADQYIDTNSSESQSPVTSPVSFSPHRGASPNFRDAFSYAIATHALLCLNLRSGGSFSLVSSFSSYREI